MIRKALHLTASVALASVLTACGGGGGGDDPNARTDNAPTTMVRGPIELYIDYDYVMPKSFK